MSPVCADEVSVTVIDSPCDVVARRTDPGADAPFNPQAHRLIELLEWTIGGWSAVNPETDLFTGSFTESGEFVRLDIVLRGLLNPPGSVDPLQFTPFQYGDHPIFGFVEIDMDEDNETGGELGAPQFRYLGNIVRLGGAPSDSEFEDRFAEDGSAFDGDFLSEPFVERHGEEFHLALLGGQVDELDELEGNGDSMFDEGETWNLKGPWFHRAHGYEPFSLAKGGGVAGEYAPGAELQFHHDPAGDTTTVSLVFPLTNVGAGLMRGEAPEPNDHDPSNHASVFEALSDLVVSAILLDMFPTGLPEEAIIIEWKDEEPEEFLDPTDWRVTALLGSSYTAPNPAGVFFVWTDAYPNVIIGDVDGEDGNNEDDKHEIQKFIEEQDASDGVVDGRVVIIDFATDFSVFDVNHNGIVDGVDVALVDTPGPCAAIPTVSKLGMLTMALLVLTTGALVLRRRISHVEGGCTADVDPIEYR